MKKQEKVKKLYELIKENFYLGRNDFETNEERFNSSLLFGTLTQLTKGNILLFGEYGGGKTTSAEYLNSIFNGLPLDLVKRAAIRGDPQKTEEKMIGRPHYGQMHKGKEDVIWQHFVQIGPKIFDEFNRIPESNQSIVLNGVDRGEWNYLNETITNGSEPFFATCNYADSGNNDIIPPILDRFDVATESKFPGVINSLVIAENHTNSQDEILINKKLTQKALDILSSGKPYEENMKALQDVIHDQKEILNQKGFPVLTREEEQEIKQEIKNISLSEDASIYLTFLISELNVEANYGQKRSIDPINLENGSYLSSTFTGSGSNRTNKSLVNYAKSLAWLQGKKEVELEHIIKVAPYTLWHKINWTPQTINEFKDDKREDPLNLYITKMLLGRGTENLPGVQKRFFESQDNYKRVLGLIGNNDIQKALRETEALAGDGVGHPLFYDLAKDLKDS